MRSLISLPLILIFAVAFAGFFLLDSVARYASDADAFAETAREARVRGTLVEVTEEFIYGELQKDPTLAGISREELRAIVDGVISEAWFDESVRAAHRATLEALDEAKESAIVDLRGTKRALRDAMADLERRAGEACVRLLGAQACADADQAAVALAAYRARSELAIGRIADEIDIVAEITGDGSRAAAKRVTELELVRKHLGNVRTLRWIGLGVVVGCLVLLALINGGRLSRMLRAVGFALILGAALYLVTVSVTSGYLREVAAEHLAEARDERVQLAGYDRMLAEGSQRFAVELVARSTSHSTGAVLLIGVVGLFALAGGVLGRR